MTTPEDIAAKDQVIADFRQILLTKDSEKEKLTRQIEILTAGIVARDQQIAALNDDLNHMGLLAAKREETITALRIQCDSVQAALDRAIAPQNANRAIQSSAPLCGSFEHQIERLQLSLATALEMVTTRDLIVERLRQTINELNAECVRLGTIAAPQDANGAIQSSASEAASESSPVGSNDTFARLPGEGSAQDTASLPSLPSVKNQESELPEISSAPQPAICNPQS